MMSLIFNGLLRSLGCCVRQLSCGCGLACFNRRLKGGRRGGCLFRWMVLRPAPAEGGEEERERGLM